MTPAMSLIQEAMASAVRPCLTSSFQADCVVLLHMVREIRPDIPVLFLDTVHHFPQTLAYRDDLAARWGLNVITVRAAEPAPGLWRTDTRSCCDRHKVEPLFRALSGYDLWLTALRREQSPSRAQLAESEPFPLPGGAIIRKVSPLAGWTWPDVLAYAGRHEIPLLPLYATGYLSIGCEPCTSVPVDRSDPRSGRWQGQKLECGIHVAPAFAPAVAPGARRRALRRG